MANPNKQDSLLADKSSKPMISTQQSLLADLSVAYVDDGSADDLDTDAKRVVAMNSTNNKINKILDILEAHGLMADA